MLVTEDSAGTLVDQKLKDRSGRRRRGKLQRRLGGAQVEHFAGWRASV